MTEPVSLTDISRVDFADGAPKNDFSGGTRYFAESQSGLSTPPVSKSAKSASAREYAVAVQARFNDAGSNVRVGIDTVNGNIVFTIRDSESGQVIRKIPSDEAIRIANNIDNVSGLYVDRLE
jgi:flagellar protein FlaG